MVVPPTLTLGASTNYNQNSAVLNATVTATGNRAITSVEFQYSTSATFASGNSAWIAAATNTVINQGTTGTARTLNATGLSNGTAYYVRFRATNSSGFVTTSAIGGGFTTYSLRTSTFNSSSTWSNPVPSSGTSGLAITQILNLDCRAAGGGTYSGYIEPSYAGGGGARTTASSASVGSSVAVTVGAGGGLNGTGGSTTIGTLLAAAGGTAFDTVFLPDLGITITTGGSSGNGNAAGSNISTFFLASATGGGGGAGGVGGDAYLSNPADPNSAPVGGNAGPGWTAGYGEGGKGSDTNFNPNPVSGGANTGNGAKGGQSSINFGGTTGYIDAFGGSGYAQFQYWGP